MVTFKLGGITISIHAPTRGATTSVPIATWKRVYFNPRSHKGSDIWQTCEVVYRPISIHAPTRGATLVHPAIYTHMYYFNPRSHKGSDGCAVIYCHHHSISIHAPTRGATSRHPGYAFALLYFNPRSHKGSDGTTIDGYVPENISIHAPTRGATVNIAISVLVELFQSTLPQGERPHAGHAENCSQTFQSTLPQGERQFPGSKWRTLLHFNPRSHKGSDQPGIRTYREYYISIHAPTRGATSLMVLFISRKLFQSTLPQGERPIICSI